MSIAVAAMQSGVIEGALIGGVSLLTSPRTHEIFARRKLLQPQGEFHIFDNRASGVVLGEGCGVVYLKPVSQARQDGDYIYAVIAGISTNNDGRTAGPATPNIEAQTTVMRSALTQSGCCEQQVRYLEVNGSGSEVTDLLELKAIAAAYSRDKNSPLYLGSMKPNIGHPLCAEGIASFIKIALMLDQQSLVPFLSGQQPLKHYSLEDAGFTFPKQSKPQAMKYTALNCFADGGTNAHIILEQGDSGTKPRKSLPLPQMQRIDVRSQQALQGLKKLDHSFGTSQVWSKELTADHPIFANHKAYGQELLPGVAWIDLLFQWFKEAGFHPKTLALKNLSIYRPLTVMESQATNLSLEAVEKRSRNMESRGK